MVLLKFLSVAIGTAVTAALLFLPGDILQAGQDRCLASPNPSFFGVYGIDALLCVLLGFFQHLYDTPYGAIILDLLSAPFIAVIFFLAIESGRQGVKGALRYPVALLLLGQLVGIGSVSPMFIFTSYLSNKPAPGSPVKPVSSSRVQLGLFLVLQAVGFMIFFNSLPVNTELYAYVHVLFQFSPLIFLLLNLTPAVSQDEIISARPGSRVAQFGYSILAGASLCIFLNTLSKAALHYMLIPESVQGLTLSGWLDALPAVFNKFWADVISNKCALALTADFGGIMAFVLLFVLTEEGLGGLLSTLLLSLLFSPGFATAMVFSRREKRIEQAGDKSKTD